VEEIGGVIPGGELGDELCHCTLRLIHWDTIVDEEVHMTPEDFMPVEARLASRRVVSDDPARPEPPGEQQLAHPHVYGEEDLVPKFSRDQNPGVRRDLPEAS
jgi:hypothetical protein